MILPTILVLAGLFSLFLLLYVVRGRRGGENTSDLVAEIRPLDLEAFGNLTDANEEQFLRNNLSREEFRAVQRARLRAAVDYVVVITHNATVLARWGEAAGRSQDPHIAQEGRKLVDNAARLRLYSLLYLAKLYATIMLPGASLSLGPLVDNYQRLKSIAGHLALLQQPRQASQLSAMLG